MPSDSLLGFKYVSKFWATPAVPENAARSCFYGGKRASSYSIKIFHPGSFYPHSHKSDLFEPNPVLHALVRPRIDIKRSRDRCATVLRSRICR